MLDVTRMSQGCHKDVTSCHHKIRKDKIRIDKIRQDEIRLRFR